MFNYLLSGSPFSDLCLNSISFGWVQVWDYGSKDCLHVLKGHEHNVTAIFIHPQLPVVITGSEDKTVRLWSKATNW